MKIRFAVTPPAATHGEAQFGDYLRTCEALGFDTVWLSDLPLGGLGDPLLSLTYAAAVTRKLKLGANVVPLGRNPLWLAKQLAQLDRISGGRLLLSFVPGLGAPAERAALGCPRGDRGRMIEDIMSLLRRWWAGETVSAHCGEYVFDNVALAPRPLQEPLEIWLGGNVPAALSRLARIADGWLTSAVTPAEAAAGRAQILSEADACGHHIDVEHFGISVGVALAEPHPAALAVLANRRADRDLTDIVPHGVDALRRLVEAHCANGISKFVLRPLDRADGRNDWRADLEAFAAAVLPLQT